MAKSNTFLTNLNEEEITLNLNNTEVSYNTLNSLSDQIITSYTSSLEDVMKRIYSNIIDTNGNYDPRLLDQYCLELTNVLYFMQQNLESIGLKEDISKALAQEAYNNAYLENQVKDSTKTNKTTVAELTAMAQEASKQESVVNFLYGRCYKLFKAKIDSGYEMVNTLRKIITKNIQEMSLSYYKPNTKE